MKHPLYSQLCAIENSAIDIEAELMTIDTDVIHEMVAELRVQIREVVQEME